VSRKHAELSKDPQGQVCTTFALRRECYAPLISDSRRARGVAKAKRALRALRAGADLACQPKCGERNARGRHYGQDQDPPQAWIDDHDPRPVVPLRGRYAFCSASDLHFNQLRATCLTAPTAATLL
jgi:hypothetical protein